MAKTLTAAAVLKLQPAAARREIPDAGSGGLKLVIQPSGAKSWAMRFRRPDGKLAKLTLGPVDLSGKEAAADPVIGQPLTLAAARALAAEIGRQRARDVDVVAEHRIEKRSRRTLAAKNAATSFGHEARYFIESYKFEKGPRKGQRPRTWRENAKLLGLDFPADYLVAGGEPTVIKDGLCDRWRDTPVNAISKDAILDLIEETQRGGIPGLETRNKAASEARGRHLSAALGTMFKWLSKKRKISVNPFIGMDRPAPSTKRSRFLNFKTDVRKADELRWFWTACDKVGGPFGAVCKLLLLTGCRRDEIALMTRDELGDDLAMLRLPGERTKNGLPHEVPLPPLAQKILKDLLRVSDKYVFSTNGTAPVSGFNKIKERLDAQMLAEAQKEKGKFAPWRLHDLRRTCATGMGEIGVLPHVVEAVLNHISGTKGGVAGVYQHAAYSKEKKAALERWANYVISVVTGRTAKVLPMRGRSST